MKRDFANSLSIKPMLQPGISTFTTDVDSLAIDIRDSHSATVLLQAGNLPDADGTFNVQLMEGDSSTVSTHTLVEDTDMTALTQDDLDYGPADDRTAKIFGYIGTKRYISLEITPSANSSSAFFSAMCLLEPDLYPQQ